MKFTLHIFLLSPFLPNLISAFEVPDEIDLPGEFKLSGLFFGCDRDVTLDYHRSLQDFSTRLFKKVAEENGDHFVLSQYSIWLALSAFAEGSDDYVQIQLFNALNLPIDSCVREKYYEIATSLETSADDVTLSRTRMLVIDVDVKLNDTWASDVRASGLIDNLKAPIANNTEASNILRNIINVTKDLNINGNSNSIVLDSLDYKGLWTTAFDNASTETGADFFNDNGERIGKVDLLKVKERVKLAYIPFLNVKLMELPVGYNGRYRMLFIMNRDKTPIRRTIEHFPSSFIIDIMPFLIKSIIPLEVSIPRLAMTSEFDLKKALEGIGLGSIWKEENATKYISDPQLRSSTVYQRVSVTMDGEGVTPQSATAVPNLSNAATGVAGIFGREFIANRPFIYGLIDSQTRTWLFTGVFSGPRPYDKN